MDPTLPPWAALLAEMAERNGITYQILALRLGTSETTAWRWLRGQRAPDNATASRILDVLGADSDQRREVFAALEVRLDPPADDPAAA